MTAWRRGGLPAICCLLAVLAAARGEQRVVVKTVRYVLGEQDTRQEARERALREAKRQALEESGVFVEAATSLRERVHETSTTYHDESELDQDVRQITAGVTHTEVLGERWLTENGAIVLELDCRVACDPRDVREKIEQIIAQRRRLTPLDPVANELARLKIEMAEIRSAAASAAPVAGTGAVATATGGGVLRSPPDPLAPARLLYERALYDEAVNAVERVLAASGPSAEAHILAGQCYAHKKGWYREAVNELEMALKLDPKSIHARLILADVHLRIGNRPADARRLVQEVLLLDPANRDAAKLLLAIEQP